jgi:hypothetical protein
MAFSRLLTGENVHNHEVLHSDVGHASTEGLNHSLLEHLGVGFALLTSPLIMVAILTCIPFASDFIDDMAVNDGSDAFLQYGAHHGQRLGTIEAVAVVHDDHLSIHCTP